MVYRYGAEDWNVKQQKQRCNSEKQWSQESSSLPNNTILKLNAMFKYRGQCIFLGTFTYYGD